MAAVVFCPYGQVSIFINSSLLFPVPVPWVVGSRWSLHLSPVTNSVTFSSVSLFRSSLAVVPLILFSLANHGSTRALTISSVYFSMYPGVLYSLQLLLAPHHSFCVPSKISSACDAKSTFKMPRAVLYHSLASGHSRSPQKYGLGLESTQDWISVYVVAKCHSLRSSLPMTSSNLCINLDVLCTLFQQHPP